MTSSGHAPASLTAEVPMGNFGDLEAFTSVFEHVTMSDLCSYLPRGTVLCLLLYIASHFPVSWYLSIN
jgi:hypothetical protein